MVALRLEVESTFQIRGRGLVIVCFSAEQYKLFQVGQNIVILKPDGSRVSARIKGIEYPPSLIWVEPRPAEPRYGLLVGDMDVPVGSTVVIVDESNELQSDSY